MRDIARRVGRFSGNAGALSMCEVKILMTSGHLWTDPVGLAALHDVWGEKLGGPRAGV